MPEFLVGAGGRLFTVEATDPHEAIVLMKTRIMLRALEGENRQISMTLVEAHRQGTLNYIVFDKDRKKLLAGEHHGQFQQPVTRELSDAMRHLIPREVYHATSFAPNISLAALGFTPEEAAELIRSLNRRLND